MAAEKWVVGVSSLVAAGLTGYKAYDDYTKGQAASLVAMAARDKAMSAQGEAATALNNTAMESDQAAASYNRAAIVFGIGSLITTGLALYTLWPRKR
jgi:uncharacterized membrane protein YebE (DUF533 family)